MSKENSSSPENKYWLVKFAPFRTSWQTIVKRGSFTLRGVRNPQARNNLADMRKGDLVLFYHSQQERTIVGLMEVSRESYPNPTSADPKWLTCDFVPVRTLPRPVILTELKLQPNLVTLPMLRQPRLSVMPLTGNEYKTILDLLIP